MALHLTCCVCAAAVLLACSSSHDASAKDGTVISKEERVITIEHYKVACSVCGAGCSDYLCLQATIGGEPEGTYLYIEGLSYAWGTRYVINALFPVYPDPPEPDTFPLPPKLVEVLETQVQPKGTPFTAELSRQYLDSGTEADLQLVDPFLGKTERHIACASAEVCDSLTSFLDVEDKYAHKTVLFEQPASPSEPLVAKSQ